MTARPDGASPAVDEAALYYEDFEIGRTFLTGTRRVTAEDILAFSALTGDDNPLHSDPEFARNTPFGSVIAHGLLGTSLAIGLIARLRIVTGTALALLEAHPRFLRPVLAGDEVRAEVTVTGKRETSRPDRGILWRGVRLLNQRDEVVQEIEFTSLIRRRTGGDTE